MAIISVKDRKYLVQKVVVTGEGVQGPQGEQGPAGPGYSPPIPSSDVQHDGTERNSELVSDLIDELFYVATDLLTFTNQHGNQEKGATLPNVALDWTRNKDVTSQQITGSGISPTDPGASATNYTIVGINLTANGSWTLLISDGQTNDQLTTSINFYNKIHWGARVPGTVNDAFVLGLGGNSLQATFAKTFTVTAGASDKIYFALPTAYGTPTFVVGGFAGGFTKIATFSHINASGHSESYDVWESDNFNLGLTTVTVQ